jgi:DNA-binding NtrC family response regulator
MERARVLVVDDKESVLEVMASILGEAYDVATAADAAAALALLGARPFDVVLTDVRMPGATGFDLLDAAKRVAPETVVVLMTGFASIPDAVAAIRRGAFDYVAKPLQAEEVCLVVARALADRSERGRQAAGEGAVATDFREALLAARDRASRDYLVTLMRQFRGNVTRAADHARMTRENLHRLLKKYGVRSEAYKTVRPA